MNDLSGTFLPARAMVAGDEGFIDGDLVTGIGPSAGTLLRHARETAGISILALAVSLKVPVKKLEALEADRLDLLPDAVFARALASSVCRTLKIDVLPVLSQLPKTGSHRLTTRGERINTPFKAPGVGYRLSVWGQISRPAVLACVVLVLGALVLWQLPAVRISLLDASRTTTPANQRVAPDNARAPISSVTAESDPNQISKLEAESRPLLSAFAPASAAGAPLVLGPMSEASASAAVTDPAAGVVVFRASGASWVEVTDARGQVVLRRLLNAGEVAGASGALPLTAVVGRADLTQVQVRGKAVDLTSFVKDNVARFEVK